MTENNSTSKEIAYLCNDGEYTIFTYDNQTVKFLTSKRLKRYTKIKHWENEIGYLVVDRENNDSTIMEDYIDLLPILKDLHMDPISFLGSIKEVRLLNVN